MNKIIYHRDGTITYWSVYNQVWKRHVVYVPDNELSAMSRKNCRKVIKHLGC